MQINVPFFHMHVPHFLIIVENRSCCFGYHHQSVVLRNGRFFVNWFCKHKRKYLIITFALHWLYCHFYICKNKTFLDLIFHFFLCLFLFLGLSKCKCEAVLNLVFNSFLLFFLPEFRPIPDKFSNWWNWFSNGPD